MTETLTGPLALEITDGIAEIRFCNPAGLNILTVPVADAFGAAVDAVLADPAVRVVVLSGDGRSFLAGGDLGTFLKAEDKVASFSNLVERVHGPLKKLEASPLLVIASVQGPVAGAGMSLALGADLCIAADDTRFTFAYSMIGAPGDCGITFALSRLVGYRRAIEIALLSEPVDVARASALGLVNRVVPLAGLRAETRAFAARFVTAAPLAVGAIKQLLRTEAPYAAQLDAEAEAFARCAGSADFTEGLTAFFAKRKPVFTGR